MPDPRPTCGGIASSTRRCAPPASPSASRQRRANASARSASAPSTDSSSAGSASSTTAGRLDRHAEPAEAARAGVADREHAQVQARGRLDADRSRLRPPRARTPSPRARAGRPSCPRAPAAAPARRGSPPASSRRAREARIDASSTAWHARLKPRNSRPAPPPTTTVLTRARSPSSIASTRTSRHEHASSRIAPSTFAAGRVGGCGSPSAAWLNRRMSSVRFTTAAAVARRFRSVRVPRKGLMTIRSLAPLDAHRGAVDAAVGVDRRHHRLEDWARSCANVGRV